MDHYRRYLCTIKKDPLDPNSLVDFEEIFINMVLLEGKKQKPLDYSKLLNLKVNGATPLRLIVQGEAGAGKTTLCAKIAWDWINGNHFQQYEMLLVVPLRESEDLNIGDVAKAYLSDSNQIKAEQLTEYILLNPSKVFIIFDGLDEFKSDIRCSSNKDIIKILRSDRMKSCLVLVTSRPWKADEIRWNNILGKVYNFVEIKGFSKENVSAYINKYFVNEQEKGKELIHFTDENDIISQSMAPFPLYVAMLCLMWHEMEGNKRKAVLRLQTFSQLFKEMVLFLKDHYILKDIPDLDDTSRYTQLQKVNEDLKPISKIAFEGLLDKNLSFDKNEFNDCQGAMETACKVGILSREKKLTPRLRWHESDSSRLEATVFFPHLLFQEYMAGMYLSSLQESEYTRLIDQRIMPQKEEFRYLLYFAASQNKTVGRYIITRLLEPRELNKFTEEASMKSRHEGGCVGNEELTSGKVEAKNGSQKMQEDTQNKIDDVDVNEKEMDGQYSDDSPIMDHEGYSYDIDYDNYSNNSPSMDYYDVNEDYNNNSRLREERFVVDVTFECHDKELAEIVKNKLDCHALTVDNRYTPAHTLEGYMFLSIDLVITRTSHGHIRAVTLA